VGLRRRVAFRFAVFFAAFFFFAIYFSFRILKNALPRRGIATAGETTGALSGSPVSGSGGGAILNSAIALSVSISAPQPGQIIFGTD